MLVRDQNVHECEQGIPKLPGRCGIEDRRDPVGPSGRERGVHGIDGSLALREHDRGIRMPDHRLACLRWRDRVIGTGHDDDAIAPLSIDLDECGAAWAVRDVHVPIVDALLVQDGAQPRPRVVLTDGPDEVHRGSEPRCGDRLIQALATGESLERGADHGFARVGKACEADDQVEIQTPDHDHGTGCRDHRRIDHGSILSVVATLGIDLGTSSVKVALVDERDRILRVAKRGYPVDAPQPGWAQTDPHRWLNATLDACGEVLAGAGHEVTAVGFSGQMHGVVLADENLEPLLPAILWADSRARPQVQRMASHLDSAHLARLGSPAVPGFAATSLAWLADERPDAWSRARYAVQPKDWLRMRLGGACATDPSDASGTLLADIVTQEWSPDVLAWAGVDISLLPSIAGSTDDGGPVLIDGTEYRAVVGGADTACAIAGLGLRPGGAYLAVGTGTQFGYLMGEPLVDRTLRTHTFALAGPRTSGWYRLAGVQSGGLVLEHAVRLLDATIEEAAAALRSGVKPDDPIFVPYLAGERTPFMAAGLQGAWHGLGLSTDRAAVLRSVLEGVAQAAALGVDAVRDSGVTLPAVVPLVGGGSHDSSFRQLLADATGLSLGGVDAPDAAVIGAAVLARGSVRAEHPVSVATVVEPTLTGSELLAERRARLVDLVNDQLEGYAP